MLRSSNSKLLIQLSNTVKVPITHGYPYRLIKAHIKTGSHHLSNIFKINYSEPLVGQSPISHLLTNKQFSPSKTLQKIVSTK
jgi:hypothetical protein